MTIKEAQELGEKVLKRAKIESKHIDTSLIIEKVTGKPRSWGFAHPEYELSKEQSENFMDLLDKRRQRVPLVHLTNNREFYGIDLFIDERVLTPRVETEKMVEWAIKHAPQATKLIDVGTGSGALAIAIKKHRPDLEIWATDVSKDALDVAKLNADKHGAEIEFVESDLWNSIPDESFNTIVTNLPYLEDETELMPEVQKEPSVALFGGKDGLDVYRRFLEEIPKHLVDGGFLFTECDPWQHESLSITAKSVGLNSIEQDYFILGFVYGDEVGKAPAIPKAVEQTKR